MMLPCSFLNNPYLFLHTQSLHSACPLRKIGRQF
ncbi:hypothetical protein J2125_004724 [Erwinia toletana]|uniref:Uncharacterized protein n=1 Tax=Winslowiella toletana TaxID=92490 RepID=A0ABS4PH94_9GAMM|nr:hypothetical protein [Winslowiella toletana]